MTFLNDIYLDAFKEVGNIGAGNAATSLSKLLNRRINMNVPEIKILRFNEVETVVGGAEKLVAGIYLEFVGDIRGTILYILDKDSANNLLHLLMPNYCRDHQGDFSKIESSALQEVGNILASAYLGSLSALTGLYVKPSTPALAYDMAGAILSVPLIEFGQVGEQAFFIETLFIDGLDRIKGNFFLIPEIDSYFIILKALGVFR
ncbi:MAG TPA: chemotaxis protein CheC [Clostridia bacterium]|nr:chemotaxis protein CheC [Clostridia bacterium]